MDTKTEILGENVIPELENLLSKLKEIHKAISDINDCPAGLPLVDVTRGGLTPSLESITRKYRQSKPGDTMSIDIISARHRIILLKLRAIEKLERELDYYGFGYKILFGDK